MFKAKITEESKNFWDHVEATARIVDNWPRWKRGELQVRNFETGATRSGDEERYDPEGFLSPLVIERFSEYMHEHRQQADGMVRDSDNWQKGMPKESYMKGMWRHFLHLWLRHRGSEPNDPAASPSIEDDLCAIIFNAQGYLHTLLASKSKPTPGDAILTTELFKTVYNYGDK